MSYLDFLPENIQVRIIHDAVLSDLQKHIEIRQNKQKVLFSLMINTHCAGCGYAYNVCLRGYTGEYCAKRCWKMFHNQEDSDYEESRNFNLEYIYVKYDYLDNVNVSSKALSKYHRSYRDSNSITGKVWPMINKPCNNWCIHNKKPINTLL